MAVLGNPVLDRLVGVAKLVIWPPMRGRRGGSRGQGRANDPAIARERLRYLGADLNVHHAIQVQRQVPAGLRQSLRLREGPYLAAQLRNHARQVGLLGLGPNHRGELRRYVPSWTSCAIALFFPVNAGTSSLCVSSSSTFIRSPA